MPLSQYPKFLAIYPQQPSGRDVNQRIRTRGIYELASTTLYTNQQNDRRITVLALTCFWNDGACAEHPMAVMKSITSCTDHSRGSLELRNSWSSKFNGSIPLSWEEDEGSQGESSGAWRCVVELVTNELVVVNLSIWIEKSSSLSSIFIVGISASGSNLSLSRSEDVVNDSWSIMLSMTKDEELPSTSTN